MRNKAKRIIRKIFLFIFIIIFLIGLGLFLYPYINGAILEWNASKNSQSFLLLQDYVPENNSNEISETVPLYPDLRADVEAYNLKILEEHQSQLRDNADYEKPSFILANYGLEDEVFGVIYIPKLELEMPIYLGANNPNLSIGAAHMSQTSLPIGGNNTNCVIAGHRGWKGASYFKNLPKLETGDEINITNLWETLNYKVIDKKIIYTTESEYIYIQENKDLVTLLTCDYGSDGSKFRYIVICERVLDK